MKKEIKYIYLCGPTVYNKVHIGNMRPIVTFDLILRGLKTLDKNIKFIHNITDIDDKIIQKAKDEKRTEEEIANQYTQFYFNMLNEFNIETIDYIPKVSENIEVIENFINDLKKEDYVYESNNSFYFETNKLKEYGEVSNNKLENLKSENENKDKKNPFDFTLWKNKTNGKTWKTSLGIGRPGWHTECAAFIYHFTKGKSLLIHGGGIDLKFPHHENENAQFRAISKNKICLDWKHIGIINFKNQKMSKSLGNIIFADQFLEENASKTESSDLFRLLILSTSYNSTIELSNEIIESLVKKMNQLSKVVNFVLLSENKPKELENRELIDSLSQGIFSNVYKYLNQKLKLFNSTKEIEVAKKLFSALNFLGFKITKKKINQKFIDIFQKWNTELQKKNYQEADKYREILLKENLI